MSSTQPTIVSTNPAAAAAAAAAAVATAASQRTDNAKHVTVKHWIEIRGPPGSGKSTMASRLREAFWRKGKRAELFDEDPDVFLPSFPCWNRSLREHPLDNMRHYLDRTISNMQQKYSTENALFERNDIFIDVVSPKHLMAQATAAWTMELITDIDFHTFRANIEMVEVSRQKALKQTAPNLLTSQVFIINSQPHASNNCLQVRRGQCAAYMVSFDKILTDLINFECVQIHTPRASDHYVYVDYAPRQFWTNHIMMLIEGFEDNWRKEKREQPTRPSLPLVPFVTNWKDSSVRETEKMIATKRSVAAMNATQGTDGTDDETGEGNVPSATPKRSKSGRRF